jgi:hypothetical protein
MNKTRIIIASIGGTCLLAALVLAYLAFDSFSTGVETQEELQAMETAIGNYVKAAVKPMQASVDAVEANRKAYADWIAEAKQLAERGDKEFAPTTDAAFKTFMVSEAKRMAALPGGAAGKLVKEDFPFGFQSYILDGAMPPAAELPKLQRQWDDVTTVVTTLAESGVYELTSLKLVQGASAIQQPQNEPAKGGRKRGAAKPAKAAAEESPIETTVMAVEFTTRPSGLVGVLNRFAESERFTVVEKLQFAREKDDLMEALGGEKKAETAAAAPTGRGRGRRRAVETVQEEETPEDDSAKKGQVVTDPSRASLLKVSMTVKICDFKTMAKEEVKE